MEQSEKRSGKNTAGLGLEVAENYDVVGRRGDLWILEDKVDE